MRLKLFFYSLAIGFVGVGLINSFERRMESFWLDLASSKLNSSVYANVAVAKKEIILPSINAKAALSVAYDKNGNAKEMFSKNPDSILPIASLSKLMAADVVLENYDSTSIAVMMGEDAINERGEAGGFNINDTLSVKELLISGLTESSNDAISAISGVIGKAAIVDLMNLEAKNIGMKNSKFYNPTGLDPDEEKNENKDFINTSTANDIALLSYHIINIPEAVEYLSQKQKNIFTASGNLHHIATTTNLILAENSEIDGKIIIAGKTGETPRSGECLMLALKNPKSGNILINVVLGSNDRFGEMKKLVSWLDKNKNW